MQYKVVLHTGLVGSVSRQITMQLVFADSRWGIVWDDGLILPELKDGGNLLMEYASPARGNIYDRSGLAFAAQTDAVAIGVVAGEILPDQEGLLLSELSRLLNVHPEALRSRYAEAGPDWYVALGEASIEQVSSRFGVLNNISGLRLNQYQTRYYMGGVAGAPHAVGYVAPIPAAEVAAYQAQGYSPDAFVGAQGLEKWGEKQLAGERGGTLWVRTASVCVQAAGPQAGQRGKFLVDVHSLRAGCNSGAVHAAVYIQQHFCGCAGCGQGRAQYLDLGPGWSQPGVAEQQLCLRRAGADPD